MTLTATSAPTSNRVGETPLLAVRDLHVHFSSRGGWFGHRRVVRAVAGVSFELREGETLGLVGESGCGKSTLARAVLNLVRPTMGEVWLGGERIDRMTSREMWPLRRQAQMIFQDPYASLNPRHTIGHIIAEPLAIYFPEMSLRDRRLEAMRLLDLVGLNPLYLNRYPHEFSGGQRQRVGVARALALRPRLVVCDEPVSALDVSIQAQVVNLLVDLQQKLGLAYLFISHDLAVVRHVAKRIGVMYLGRIVELAEADSLYRGPRHPYTQSLLSAAPTPDPQAERSRRRIILKGEAPSPDREYRGCPFADRCPVVEDRCRLALPVLRDAAHSAACVRDEGTS